MQLLSYKIDLHLHSALSPCAEKEMTPPKIIHAARAKGLKMIAITDHNTAENAVATIEAAKGSGIFVIPGMEVETAEEVHVTCLFPTLTACLAWQDTVYQSLPRQDNQPDVFGRQQVLDRNGHLIRELPQMLLVSTKMSIETVAAGVTKLGGLCIPAHIDRPSYSVITALGFVPDGLPVTALELSKQTSSDEAAILFPSLSQYSFISSSDAHCLRDLGSNTSTLYCNGPPDFAELRKALAKISGRKVTPKMKDLSMHIIDIVQNSIEAGAANIKLFITENTANDDFTIEITDNGRGMDQETVFKVIDPFFTTRKTRRVGLGIPLLKAAAERCEGKLELDSSPGTGTRVTATFRHSHIDRAPLGNIIDAIINLVAAYPQLDLLFCHKINSQEIIFDAKELREQLEDVPLNNPAVVSWLKKYLTESYAAVSGKA